MILFLFIDLFLICTESVIFIIFFVCISQHCVVSTNFTFQKKKISQHCVLCFLIIHIIWMHRQRTFAQMMRTMMTRIMITVMMKSCNHLLMRWTLSFSSWILSKVNRNSFFNLCETQGLFFFFRTWKFNFSLFSESSHASIRSIEAPEPYTDAWLPLSSTC